MIVAVLLAVLALIDCGLCGIRAATGTEGHIEKRAYYISAVRRALQWGSLVVAALVLLCAILVVTSPHPRSTWQSFVEAGRVCVLIYGAFATTILVAFGFYFSPVGDFRVLTNVIVFGPLTLARPYVIVAGLTGGVYAATNLRVTALAVLAGTFMLPFQRVVERTYVTRWRRLLRDAAKGAKKRLLYCRV